MRADELGERVESLAAERGQRLRGRNLWLVAVRPARRAVEVRVTGLAAEMTYYTLLSLVPLLTAVGASLGLLERVLGVGQVAQLEDAVVAAFEGLLSRDVTAEVVTPLVRGLLREERTGFALGSILVALWLGSRVFRAAVRALDDAYEVRERRSLLAQLGLAVVFGVGAVVAVTALLIVVVVGPLLGGGRALADQIGLGAAFEVAWAVGRWPVVLLVLMGFLLVLYRFAPNHDLTWRDCLPGAVVGAVGMALVAVGFRVWLEVAGPRVPELGDADEVVAIAAQVVGAVVAGILLVWLSSIAVLLAGVLNAEWSRSAADEEPAGT